MRKRARENANVDNQKIDLFPFEIQYNLLYPEKNLWLAQNSRLELNLKAKILQYHKFDFITCAGHISKDQHWQITVSHSASEFMYIERTLFTLDSYFCSQ